MSRSINKCHFLPRKPGGIAYAGEETIWIVTITNTFRICLIFPTVFNRGLITSGVILPSGCLAVKQFSRGQGAREGRPYNTRDVLHGQVGIVRATLAVALAVKLSSWPSFTDPA